MKLHPFCKLFPPAADQDFEALVQDIRDNGLQEPITTLDGQILDGQNRYHACIEANRPPKFEEFKGKDPLAFVISKNLHRRHLDQAQRAMVAAEMASLKQGKPSEESKPANLPVIPTQAQAATTLNVSERSVRTARAIKAHSPRLARQVKAGTLSLNAAMEKINPRPEPVAIRPIDQKADLPPSPTPQVLADPLDDPLVKFKTKALVKWKRWFDGSTSPLSSMPCPTHKAYDEFVTALLK